ncbi:MAG: hypothetical protein OJF58_002796 [Enhydrobacter sp.]|nr:MAG: hypothetical protein OJF58_002796 [Enhydrobacter sp.]
MSAQYGEHGPRPAETDGGRTIVGGRRHGQKAGSGAQARWRRGCGPSIVSAGLG